MSVNSSTPVYGSLKLEHYVAVVDVDVSEAYPNDPTRTTAKALVTINAGTVNSDGALVPTGENVDVTASLLALTAQVAGTFNSADQINSVARGVQLGINVTLATTVSVVFKIQGKDVVSGVYYDILDTAAIIATGFTSLTVYPGAAATANVSSPQPLPRTWRVQAVITGTGIAGVGDVTATVGASLII